MTQHLLATKIQIPSLPTSLVPRRRLFTTLDRGLEPNVRSTLISAPAGYGKTTLLNAWVRDRDLATAWLSISEEDNDPTRFVAYLFAALRWAKVDVDDPSDLDRPFPDEGPQPRFLIPAINEIDHLPGQLVLVLDDYYLIRNQHVHDHVSFLLENLPPHAHLFIGTRPAPPLPIARLRGRGQVNELRMQDLRLREGESESYLNILFDLGLSSSFISLGRIIGPSIGGLAFGLSWSLPFLISAATLMLGFTWSPRRDAEVVHSIGSEHSSGITQ